MYIHINLAEDQLYRVTITRVKELHLGMLQLQKTHMHVHILYLDQTLPA